MLITCPSGLSGEIRPFQVGDLDSFLDRSLRNQPGPVLEFALARRVWVSTESRGPYVFEGPQPPCDGDILTGDRFHVLVQSRILARGPIYEFEVRCDDPACGQSYTWEVDLRKLPVKTLSEASAQAFAAGNRLSTQLPNGAVVSWALPTGRSQKLADRFQKEHGRGLAVVYAARLLNVPDVEPRKHVEWMRTLDLAPFDALVADMEAKDCGVETAVETMCPDCGNEQVGDVGLGRGFFSVDRKLQRAKEAKERESR
jgi:hypothetical protein